MVRLKVRRVWRADPPKPPQRHPLDRPHPLVLLDRSVERGDEAPDEPDPLAVEPVGRGLPNPLGSVAVATPTRGTNGMPGLGRGDRGPSS